MPYKSILASEAMARYVNEVMVQETPLQQRLRAETAALPMGVMQISPDQGRFLALLVGLTGARRALEVGTFTGYSALCVASVLPADGRLVACDISAEWTAIGRRYWEEAGVADRIDLRLGPARDTLEALQAEGAAGTFDIAFIDADKDSNEAYYEAALGLLRPGGLIAIDNMMPQELDGASAPSTAEQSRLSLNEKLRDDPRGDAVMATVGPGLMLIRKR